MKIQAPVHYERRQSVKGFSLLEVLIALVVVSIGLIGLAAIQQTGARNNHNALLHAQASMLAYEASDMMRANSRGVRTGRYNASEPPAVIPACATTADATAVDCDYIEMASFHLGQWYAQLAERLPQGNGTIDCIDKDDTDVQPCSVGSVVEIAINWVESGIAGTETLEFVTEVQL